MHGHGLEDVLRPLVGLVEHVGVAPHLGVERGAAGVEVPHHRPGAAPEPEGLPETEAGVGGRRVPADHQLGQAGLEEPPRGHPHRLAHLEDPRGDTPHLDVGVGAGRGERERRDHHDLRAGERPLGVAGDADGVLHELDLVEAQGAVHLGGGPGAQDDGVGRRARGHERRPEPLGERQHGDEDAHRAGDAEHRHHGGVPALPHGAQVVDERDRHAHTLRSASTTRSRIADQRRHERRRRGRPARSERPPAAATLVGR